MKQKVLWPRVAISIVAAALLLARVAWPTLNIDLISIGLLAVGAIPWLWELIDSATLPGGVEIKFRDVEKAAEQITTNAPLTTTTTTTTTQKPGESCEQVATTPIPSAFQVVGTDGNLALVALRIEIERRLRALCQKHGLATAKTGVLRMLRDLANKGVLDSPTINGLERLSIAGNEAAHGAAVDSQVAEWAKTEGPLVIAALDRYLLEP